jgi:hypothetical protein
VSANRSDQTSPSSCHATRSTSVVLTLGQQRATIKAEVN